MVDRVLRIVVEGKDKSGSSALKNLNNDLGSLVTTGMKFAGTAVAIGATAKAVYELGKAGAGITRLRDAGEDLASSLGSDFEEIQSAIRQASLGTVSDLDIMRAANRAMMLGISADAEQLGRLMEVAAFRGRAMGLSTTQAFEDIVTGIGRMSPLILDNLGIVIDAEKRYKEYADSMGISSDALDSAAKRQILLNGVLTDGQAQIEAAGGLALDSAGKIERMEASTENAGNAIKEFFAPAVANLADSVFYLLTGMDQINSALEKHAGDVTETAKSYKEYSTEITRAAVAAGKMSEEERQMILTWADSGRTLDDLAHSTDMYEAGLVGLIIQLGLLSEAEWEAAHAGKGIGADMNELIRLKAEDAEVTGKAAESNKVLAGSMGDVLRSIQGTKRAAMEASEPLSEFLSILDADVASPIAGFIEDMKWWIGGGGQINEAFQQLKEGVAAGQISPQDAEVWAGELYKATQDLQVDLNMITAEDAAANISETLGGSLEEAAAYITSSDGIKGALEEITGTVWWIDFAFRLGIGPGGGSIPTPITYPGGVKPGGASRAPKAGGGPVWGGVDYVWNESGAGPEVLVPAGNGYVLNRDQAEQALAGGGGGVSITQIFNVPGDYKQARRGAEEGVMAAMRARGM